MCLVKVGRNPVKRARFSLTIQVHQVRTSKLSECISGTLRFIIIALCDQYIFPKIYLNVDFFPLSLHLKGFFRSIARELYRAINTPAKHFRWMPLYRPRPLPDGGNFSNFYIHSKSFLGRGIYPNQLTHNCFDLSMLQH